MSNNKLKKVSLAAVATVATAGTANAARSNTVDKLIARIRDKSDKVRADAWLSAGEVGAPAVKPLATVMTDKDLEVARAAKHGLWKVVRHVGRPGAGGEKRAVTAELIALLSDNQPTPVRRECSGCFLRLVETSPSRRLPHCYRTRSCVRTPGWCCSAFPAGSPLRRSKPD